MCTGGYLYLFSVQGHFEVIRCVYDFDNLVPATKITHGQVIKL